MKTAGLDFADDLDDVKVSVVEDENHEVVFVSWYRTRDDRRRDVIRDKVFASWDEYRRNKPDVYEIIEEERVNIIDFLTSGSTRSVNEKKLDDMGVLTYFDFGEFDRFESWMEGKEIGRDFTVFFEGRGMREFVDTWDGLELELPVSKGYFTER